MLERREDLSFCPETLQNKFAGVPHAHQLDRHLLFEFGICATGPPDLSHAAASQARQQLIGADAASAPVFRGGLEPDERDVLHGRSVYDCVRSAVRLQQRHHFRAQLHIVGAGLLEESAAARNLEFIDSREHFLHALPALGRHGRSWTRCRARLNMV